LPEPAFVLLGSNIAPERYLPQGIKALPSVGRVVRVSPFYQSPAVGPRRAPDYLNAAVLLETDLPALEILRQLRHLEASHGRRRTADKFAPRTLDLDLCLLGAVVLDTRELTLPHPDILSQPHVAIPLADLSPGFPHPITGESLGAIAQRLRRGASIRQRPDLEEQRELRK
jgi:2-amino-4-hydroxy-6-hydroxymethyldihydropteridine diphosphokinase